MTQLLAAVTSAAPLMGQGAELCDERLLQHAADMADVQRRLTVAAVELTARGILEREPLPGGAAG